MISQLIPEGYCLKCQGCCRFKEPNSVWSPCLLQEEIEDFISKKIPPASISNDQRLVVIPSKSLAGQFVCPFLNEDNNTCAIYSFRPFECQLYPFLLNLRGKKVVLTVDLNCPYIKENIHTPEFKEYLDNLITFLNSPAKIKMLKDNPQILAAYEEVSEIVGLDISI